MLDPLVRFLTFYLPQFHPIPENDAWWGKGFTEWTNVARARPLFEGHYQPHVPADLGFYDLRVSDARIAQAELARRYGIEAFCYWHYWFEGKRLLERPFQQVLESGEPDFGFCLAWANESWSRRWLGEDKQILIRQTYSEQDDLAHIHWLLPAFADPRHVRVNGRPVFLIYRPRDLPNPRRTTELFRNECVRLGVSEPFLLGLNSHAPDADFRGDGFDGTVSFKPELAVLPDYMDDRPRRAKLARNLKLGVRSARLKLYDYAWAQAQMMAQSRAADNIPSVFVSWDNSPRRSENGIVLTNTSPDIFEATLRGVVAAVQAKPPQERIVFLNAWNEWAEGNHLEPDLRFGHSFLQAVGRSARAFDPRSEFPIPVVMQAITERLLA